MRVAKGPSWPFLEKKYKMDGVVNLIQPKPTVKPNSASRLHASSILYLYLSVVTVLQYNREVAIFQKTAATAR